MDALEVDRWHGADVATWRRRWRVPSLRIFQRVGSTNDIARDMAEGGAPEGALVLADEQTRGRGRRGRVWKAPAGASLSMSMLLRPPSSEATRVLTLRLGLAAAVGLDRYAPSRVGLKWPNDLVVEGRKVGGILCEAVAVDDRTAYVIAGIGLNLRRPRDGWAPEIADRATSLEEARSGPVDPEAVVERVVTEWLRVTADPGRLLSPSERAAFDQRDVLRGREITLDGRPVGIATGISPAGALRVRAGDGTTEIIAGTIRTSDPLVGERT